MPKIQSMPAPCIKFFAFYPILMGPLNWPLFLSAFSSTHVLKPRDSGLLEVFSAVVARICAVRPYLVQQATSRNTSFLRRHKPRAVDHTVLVPTSECAQFISWPLGDKVVCPHISRFGASNLIRCSSGKPHAAAAKPILIPSCTTLCQSSPTAPRNKSLRIIVDIHVPSIPSAL